MTNNKLLTRLGKVEKELAETKRVLDHVVSQIQKWQIMTGYVMAFVPEISEAAKTMTLQQCGDRAEEIRKSVRKLVDSAGSETAGNFET